jgi:hypothetical protein
MDAPRISTDHDPARRWLGALLVVGLCFHLVAAWFSPGVIHPDEHQQYMEQAFRLEYGYGALFWEQERGIRHPLLPSLLSLVLHLSDQAGLDDADVQAALLRLAMTILAYGAMSFLCWSVFVQGHRAAGLALALFLAFSIDLIFVQARILSEVAAMVPLALALAWWPRRPFLVGLALGVMITLRLQTAPLALGMCSVALWHDLRSGSPLKMSGYLALGLGATLLAAGWQDAVFHGSWFHSFYTSVTAQVVEDGASQFGTAPANRYVVYGILQLLRVSVFALPLFVWGIKQRPDLGWSVFLFVALHSLIQHKEVRFLWPLAPIGCLLVAFGFEDLYCRGLNRRPRLLQLLVASFLLASIVRTGLMEWKTEPYASSRGLLVQLGQHSDLRGIAVVGVPRWICGNYFFLRQDVPIEYLQPQELAGLCQRPQWISGKINYVMAPDGNLPASLQDLLTLDCRSEGWAGYRRK